MGGEGAAAAAESNQIMFPAGNPIPNSKLLTFYRTETFAIEAFYPPGTDLPKGATSKIGTYTVSAFWDLIIIIFFRENGNEVLVTD